MPKRDIPMSHIESSDHGEVSHSSLEDRRALQRFPPGAPPLSPYATLDQSALSGGNPDDLGGFVEPASPPVDHGHVCFVIMILLGVSVLLNWNTMITAYDYFHLVLERDDFEFYFTLFFNIPCFSANVWMIRYGQVFPLMTRVVVGHVSYMLIIAALPITGAAKHAGSISATTATAIVYALCAYTGLVTGVIFPTITSLAALFPARYMTAAMSGVGFGGVIVGLIRIATRASLPTDPPGVRTGSMIYFIVGATTMAGALASLFIMLRMPFAQYYIRQSEKAQLAAGSGAQAGTSERLLSDENDSGAGLRATPPGGGDGSGSSGHGSGGSSPSKVTVARSVQGGVESGSGSGGGGAMVGSSQSPGFVGGPSFGTVFRKTWKIQASIALSFMVTIGLFPGVMTLMVSQNPEFTEWFKIIMVTIFLLCDWVGRSLPNTIMLFNHRNVWIPSVLRLVFVPLFIFCVKPRIFHHDAIPYAITVAFALSNGYLCTSLMTFGPQLVEPYEMEIVGTITVFSLNGGILTGAGLGIMFSHVLDVASTTA
jgi:uncharacterized membrane protein YgcG